MRVNAPIVRTVWHADEEATIVNLGDSPACVKQGVNEMCLTLTEHFMNDRLQSNGIYSLVHT